MSHVLSTGVASPLEASAFFEAQRAVFNQGLAPLMRRFAEVNPGAEVPPGADCVVMQENCSAADGAVTILQPVGPGGLFSYRTSIAQETIPAADRRSTTLVVGRHPVTYTIQEVTVDGYAAELLDPNEAAHVVTEFARRGEERRLDFKAAVPLPDTDLDGIPDWWESLHDFPLR